MDPAAFHAYPPSSAFASSARSAGTFTAYRAAACASAPRLLGAITHGMPSSSRRCWIISAIASLSACSIVTNSLTLTSRRSGLAAAPRTGAFDLNLQREAEEDADQHDDAEHGDALERRVDDDRPDDVGHDQDLEAEQDAAAEVASQRLVGASRAHGERHEGAGPADVHGARAH